MNSGYPERERAEADQTATFVELRQSPRFPLEGEIIIHSHSAGVLKGRAVDISESGMAAMFAVEVPLNEVVQLEFWLPEGLVEIEALVRQRNAFRYGFQFVEEGTARGRVAQACRRMVRDQATKR